ncbi:uncharacterized protein LOC143913169 [Arctopsyche grandis]|uniref:uncharacterized protein LOC143913169 n=1 Tax=Arctopsyche grandis TaxID=121162 RepID=UPI00406D7EE0
MSEPGAAPRSPRQPRMGPAPFASFEDLSDEVRPKGDSPDEKPVIRLPDISEDESAIKVGASHPGPQAPNPTQVEEAPESQQYLGAMENLGPHVTTLQAGSLQTPSTPRIDISRASSSSHHDSRDSSPENAIFGIGDCTHDKEGAKLGLGFREDGTADLRSSTEELAFLEPNTVTAEKETSKQPSRRSPLMFKHEDHHRKDSQCSDIVLLSISGRTSRLSSIGSQGSAHSNVSAHSNMSHISVHSNVSHISGHSRLSVISGVSRSPSPHKMLLETSFCGPKPLENEVGVVGNDKNHADVLEQVLLSRKHDPRDAILAEGISVNKPKEISIVKNTPVTSVVSIEKPRPAPVVSAPVVSASIVSAPVVSAPVLSAPVLSAPVVSAPVEPKVINVKKPVPEPPPRESITSPVVTVSTLGASYKSDKRTSVSSVKSEVLPKSEPVPKSKPTVVASKKMTPKMPVKTSTSSSSKETEFIRIKLKPDHMYQDDADHSSQETMQKPVSLNLSEHSKKNAQHFSQLVKREDSLNKISQYDEVTDHQKSTSHPDSNTQVSNITPSASPKQLKQCGVRDKDHGSRTPSPAGRTPSRKSSFCSLFKSRETIASPESPTGSASKRKGISSIIKDTSGSIHSSRSRSKSRDRDKSGSATPTSGGKQKGSVLAIFKPNRKSSASPVARESLPNLEGIQPVEYKFSSEAKSVQNLKSTQKEKLRYYEAPVDGFIIIPLHTPSDEEEKLILSKEKIQTKPIVHDEISVPHVRVDRPVSAPSSSRPSISQPPISHPSVSAVEKNVVQKAAAKQNQDPVTKQIILPDGSIRIPLHSPSEDKLVRCDLMSEHEARELNRRCSNISTKKNGSSEKNSQKSSSEKTSEKVSEKTSSGSISSFTDTSKHEAKIVDSLDSVELVDPIGSMPEAVIEVDIEKKPDEEKMSAQAKKHIIFTTKVGSKEQLFSMQFSLSKTDSQSSQMSENRSQISEESVIEVQLSDRKQEETTYTIPPRSPSIEVKFDQPPLKPLPTTHIGEVSRFESDEAFVHSKDMTESKHSVVSNISSEKSKESPITTCRNSAISESVSPRNSVLSTDDVMQDSSESERDSELDFVRKKQLQALEKAGRPEPEIVDHERKGLVMQQDSFDDELPYVPTTLPLERSVALPIVPVKQRQCIEMKTCPIERPRSTTPINPSCLEEYCSDEVYTPDASAKERLKISLPKDETPDKPKAKQKAKSPRRVTSGSSSKTWFEFAEQGIMNTSVRKASVGHESDSDAAPPLPPRAPVPKSQWINFENIPERRKVPKRIQTIPSRTNPEVGSETNVVYTYVNPEDCKCECHETSKDITGDDATPEKEEDEEPLLDDCAENEGMSAPPVESVHVRRRNDSGRERRVPNSKSSTEHSYNHRPMCSGVRASEPYITDVNTGSNRSSVTSQDADRSSSSGSPNDCVSLPRRPPRSP